jgi:hypothetical protein
MHFARPWFIAWVNWPFDQAAPLRGFTEAAQNFPTSPHRIELGFPRCSPASDRPDASVANMASIRMRAGKFVLARFATIVGPSRSI